MEPLLRSVLFMPGDDPHKIRKAAQMDVDAVVMDLEDGVALSQKAVARQTVCDALQTVDFGRAARYVRLNPVGSDFFADDLAATLPGRPDGYVLPKVSSAAYLQELSDELDRAEADYGWLRRSIALLAVIESALGVINLAQIAQATPRLIALLFGAEDLAGDLGAIRTKAGDEVAYARSALVVAAAAYGLQAIDMVYFDLHDLAGFEQECITGRRFGYAGKMVIHPKQVAIANRIFSPSPEEIARAERVIHAYQAHQEAGVGAFELDGRMVDLPVVRAAEKVLQRARQARLF
ncbi:MAG: citrate lyase subunit beta [Chloroflexi bacterium]|nr:MAG: citrate lyase subunit beta [Chloroflexota bacterium]